VVTGGGGGIGTAIVRTFLEAGATVVAQTRTHSVALGQLSLRAPTLSTVVGDLEDERFVASLFAADATWGPVSALVNNAGSFPVQPLLETDPDGFHEVVRANAGITYSCLRRAALSMAANGGGSVTNIASLSASRPAVAQAPYNCAKAAVVTLTRSAATELAPLGIRVNAVSPGLIERPGLAEDWPEGVQSWLERCPSARLGTGADIASACLFLASPLASWITGQEVVVDGGMSEAPAY
jgi:NAD(P)-dependent dehydrogenase (short-subunit alcohol dehydrogenase family)